MPEKSVIERRDEVLVRVRNYCREATGSEIASIWFMEGPNMVLRPKFSSDGKGFPMPLTARAIVSYIARTGQFIITDDVREEPRDNQGILYNLESEKTTGTKIRQLMGVPIITDNGQTLGVIQAMNNPAGYNELDVAILQSLARFTAKCIYDAENHGRVDEPDSALEEIIGMTKEVSRAAKLQKEMMPKVPQLENFETSVLYLPCGKLGGDWYYAKKPKTSLNLLVGDGEGHGTKASLIANTCLSTVRTLFSLSQFGKPEEMASLFQALNSILVESHQEGSDDGCRGTAAYTIVLPNGQTYSLNAGHDNPILLNCKGDCREVQVAGSPILGALDTETFSAMSEPPSQFILDKGDTLVVHTDGITDLRNPKGEMYRRERLMDFMSSRIKINPDSTPDELTYALRKELRIFSGARFQRDDDITAVIGRQK